MDSNWPTVVVVGSTMIDLISYVSKAPRAGETVVGDSFQMGFGGKGANQAVMARLLGADVIMINSLGDDAYGDMTIANFATFGVDTSNIYRVRGASGVAPIWVESDGTNRIIIVPGANHKLTPEQAVRSMSGVSRASVVVGQLEILQETTAAAFTEAAKMGAVTILNPAPAAELSSDLLESSDWLIPNEVEFDMLTGTSADSDQALMSFARRTGTRLVVTLGASGAALVTPEADRVMRIPAPRVAAVDTTGAGDAFVGAFAVGVARGMEDRFAVQLGINCAADSVTRPGTQSSFPNPSRSAAFLAEAQGI